MEHGTARISLKQLFCAFAVAGLVLTAQPVKADTKQPQSLPDATAALALIRSTLVSLNEANLTANYSVLRAGSAPDFQRVYSEEKLAAIFEILRARHVDLSAAAMNEPAIKSATYVAERRAVVLEGSFAPASSSALKFETNFTFAYQYVGDRWRLYKLDLSLEPTSRGPLQTAGTAL